MKKNILITGGAGYIGSHTAKKLIDNGYNVIIADNLSNGFLESVDKRATFYQIDVFNKEHLKEILQREKIDGVLHCAGEIIVSESVENPSKYFESNVSGMNQVLQVLSECHIDKIMFSSTASVYGDGCHNKKATEETSVSPINPYAETKYMGEKLIYWMANRYNWKYLIFRYFNVAGAELDSTNGLRIAEPTHIIPNINRSALGQIKELKIFGDDYDTKDGTCIRDYIHILDLANAHLLGFNYLFENESVSQLFNLGTEEGYSVKEIYDYTVKLIGQKINVNVVERRLGDPAVVLSDTSKVQRELKWRPQYSLEDIILSDYNWRK